jgi:hypothetical protein
MVTVVPLGVGAYFAAIALIPSTTATSGSIHPLGRIAICTILGDMGPMCGLIRTVGDISHLAQTPTALLRTTLRILQPVRITMYRSHRGGGEVLATNGATRRSRCCYGVVKMR